MDESTQSFSPSYSQPASSQPKQTNPATSGLTLVIPSLKSLKASQSASKAKSRSGSFSNPTPLYQDVDIQERKIPRPVKLKPLKEVLTKLIAQLKKKDDYAFFLQPVDTSKVPGYSDIVKHPMDLGTMSDKVNRGKYRSLEEFASDFRLVTNNAKMFNPPGSIYYTEAQRLENWGLDHIAKASSTVIQYETDWNIDVEKDDDVMPVNIDGDDDDTTPAPTPMDVDSTSLRERSTSVVSQVPQQPGPSGRRGPRGPYKRQTQTSAAPGALSETLEPDGSLPGSKDGLGAFPSGSDWAKTMLALKLKGKRYKTKKERLRFEREGPPLAPDGSLDYTEMEDPFSVLSFFVPDPPTRPHLVPLYPPLVNAAEFPSHTAQAPPPSSISHSVSQSQLLSQSQQEPSSSSHTPRSHLSPGPATTSTASAPLASSSSVFSVPAFPGATSVSFDHPDLSIPFIQQLQSETDRSGKGKSKQVLQQQAPQSSQAPTQTGASASLSKSTATSTVSAVPRKRRHWTVTRTAGSYRQKGKEREDYYSYEFASDSLLAAGAPGAGEGIVAAVAAWNTPREAQATDFGSFSVLAGALAEEMQRRFGAPGPSTSTSESSAPTTGAPAASSSTTTTPTMPYSTYTTSSAVSSTSAVHASTMAPATGGVTQTQGGIAPSDQMKPGSRTDQEVTFDLIRESLDCCESVAKVQSQSLSSVGGMENGKGKGKAESPSQHVNGTSVSNSGSSPGSGSGSGTSATAKAAEYYFTTQRAAEAEEYLRDVVYGGLEGFAYVRSLAEFVDGDCYYRHKDKEEVDDDMELDDQQERKPSPSVPKHSYNPKLGMPLAQWVVQNIVDPLTEGRHSLLRDAALELARHQASHCSDPHQSQTVHYPQGSVAAQVHSSLHLYPAALLALSALVQIRLHKIDMGALIKTPNELFLSEEEWYGKAVKERRKRKLNEIEGAKEDGQKEKTYEENENQVKQEEKDPNAMEVEEEEEEPEQTLPNVAVNEGVKENGKEEAAHGALTDTGMRSSVTYEQEGPEELNQVLEYVANVLVEMDQKTRAAAGATSNGVNGHSHAATTKSEESTTETIQSSATSISDEDPLLRNLRLNLLALAKRAPLDTIARLAKDLVPEHIRHFVPTLGSNT